MCFARGAWLQIRPPLGRMQWRDERRIGCEHATELGAVLILSPTIRNTTCCVTGYLKLPRLTAPNAEDQRRAFQQTREVRHAATPVTHEQGSALAETAAPALTARVSAREFVAHVQKAQEVEGTEWSGDGGVASIAAQSATDLAHAVAIVAKAAFDEARESPHAVRVDGGSDLVMLAGTRDSIPALAAGPGAADARQVDFTRGGKGLRLIWAAFVLQRHHVDTWTHQGHRASVGFRFPLVQA